MFKEAAGLQTENQELFNKKSNEYHAKADSITKANKNRIILTSTISGLACLIVLILFFYNSSLSKLDNNKEKTIAIQENKETKNENNILKNSEQNTEKQSGIETGQEIKKEQKSNLKTDNFDTPQKNSNVLKSKNNTQTIKDYMDYYNRLEKKYEFYSKKDEMLVLFESHNTEVIELSSNNQIVASYTVKKFISMMYTSKMSLQIQKVKKNRNGKITKLYFKR